MGRNVANLMRQTKGFTPAPVIAPIGAHVIGYTRDGSVPIIKDIRVTPPNSYILGYKGYMAGDAATILAEWIPIYFTPVFQAASGLDCSVRLSTLAAMPVTARSRCNQNGNSPSQKLLTQKLRTFRRRPLGGKARCSEGNAPALLHHHLLP